MNQKPNKNIEDLVEEFSELLYSWAFYKTSHRETAEDLVQETFIAAYQSFDKFENKSNYKTWLFSILKNKISDFYRRKFKDNYKALTNTGDSLNNVPLDKFFDDNDNWIKERRPINWNDNNNLLDDDEFISILNYCMDNLPELWNSAIQFKYLTDKDSKDICKELGITPSNFWQILHRSKLQLRQCIENNWFKK